MSSTTTTKREEPPPQSGVLKHMKFVVMFSGISACIQSLIWISLTIVGIVFYLSCFDSKPGESLTFGYALKNLYFTGDDCTGTIIDSKDLLYMTSSDFFIWECVLLSMTVIWLLTSIVMMSGVKKNSNKKATTAYLITWSSQTLVISSLDLALGIFFGMDMSQFIDASKNPSTNPTNLEFLATVSGFMMAISLRVFFIWMLNVASAVYLIVAAIELNNTPDDKPTPAESMTTTLGPINAYENENKPPHWLSDNSKPTPQYPPRNRQGEVNYGYVHSMANPRFQQQKPLANIMQTSVAARNEERHSMGYNPQTNVSRNPSTRDPYTPTPDYSPKMPRNSRPVYKPPVPLPSNSNSGGYYYNNQYKR